MAFQHLNQSKLDDLFGAGTGNILAAKTDPTAALADQTGNRVKHGTFSGTIATENGVELTGMDVERRADDHGRLAISHAQICDFEQRRAVMHHCHALNSPNKRGRLPHRYALDQARLPPEPRQD